MTQDFAKPSTTRKPAAKQGKSKAAGGKAGRNKAPQNSNGRGKLVALLFALLCGFAYALYLLQHVPPTQSVAQPAGKKNKEQPAPDSPTETHSERPQRFKFYDLLPESTVETPDIDAYQFKERGAEDAIAYVIQTGSFRNASDAERQKAMIAFQGLKADIIRVKNAEGTTWHRVTTGPFVSRSEMNSALDKLVAINIEPLVKKVKP